MYIYIYRYALPPLQDSVGLEPGIIEGLKTQTLVFFFQWKSTAVERTTHKKQSSSVCFHEKVVVFLLFFLFN